MDEIGFFAEFDLFSEFIGVFYGAAENPLGQAFDPILCGESLLQS